MKISLSPLYILTYVLAIMLTTVLSMPAYPNSPPGPVSSDGHIDVQLIKSRELIVGTGTDLVLNEHQVLAGPYGYRCCSIHPDRSTSICIAIQ